MPALKGQMEKRIADMEKEAAARETRLEALKARAAAGDDKALKRAEKLAKIHKHEEQQLNKHKKILKQINDAEEKRNNFVSEASSMQEKRLKMLAKENRINKKGAKERRAALETEVRFLGNVDDSVELGAVRNDRAEEHLELIENIATGSVDIAQMQKEAIGFDAERINQLAEIQKQLDAGEIDQEKFDALRDSTNAYYDSLQGVIEGRIKLARAADLETEKMNALDAATGDWASKIKDAWKMLKLNPGAAIFAGLAALIAGAVAVLVKFSENFDEIGESMGAMVSKSKEFTASIMDQAATAESLGFELSDVLDTTTSLSSEFGIGLRDAAAMSGKVLDTAKGLGIAADEATTFFGAMMSITGLTAEQAESLAESTYQLAEMHGVAPAVVLNDMADSSEELAKFTDGTGKAMAEAAIQARKLGLSLSDSAEIAESLLDFESSLEAEMTAQMMIGKKLNLQKARELALSGDLAGMMEEVVEQVGGEAEFNKMNVLQRKALADSIGVGVDQLSKMVKGTKDLSIQGMLASENFEGLEGKDALSGISRLSGHWKKFVAKTIAKIGPYMNDFATWIEESLVSSGGLSSIVDKIGDTFKGWITYFKEVVSGWTQGKGLVASIGGFVESISTWMSKLPGIVKMIVKAFAAWKVVAIGVAIANMAAAAGASGIATAGWGIAATVIAGIAAWSALSSAFSAADLPMGKMAVNPGARGTNPMISHGGETTVRTEDLKSVQQADAISKMSKSMVDLVKLSERTEIRQTKHEKALNALVLAGNKHQRNTAIALIG
tara:strand:+ start:2425 stop:4776 length:2352 start_codon:yes stop_codon:yes gene_type:complete